MVANLVLLERGFLIKLKLHTEEESCVLTPFHYILRKPFSSMSGRGIIPFCGALIWKKLSTHSSTLYSYRDCYIWYFSPIHTFTVRCFQWFYSTNYVKTNQYTHYSHKRSPKVPRKLCFIENIHVHDYLFSAWTANGFWQCNSLHNVIIILSMFFFISSPWRHIANSIPVVPIDMKLDVWTNFGES